MYDQQRQTGLAMELAKSRRLQIPRSDLRNAAVLGAIPFLLLLPFLSGADTYLLSRSDLGTDYTAKQLPNALYLQNSWAEMGKVPTWRPQVMGGAPILGNPSYLTAYPPYQIVMILPAAWAMNVLFALHLSLAGVGLYTYARVRLGFAQIGASCSAIAFMLAPKLLAHVSGGQLDVVIAVAWLPWILLAIDRALETLSPIWAWVGGLLIGLATVAHPPTALILIVVMLTYVAYLVIRHQPHHYLKLSRSRLAGRFILVGLAATIGFLLAGGAHLAPMLDLMPHLNRSNLSLADSAAYALPPSLLTLVLAVPTVPFPEWIVYIGLGIFVFAAYGILRRHVWGKTFWLALGGVAVLFALGTSTPLYGWIHTLVPGFDLLRVPTRSWFFVGLVLSIFCGAGVQGFLAARKSVRETALVGLIILSVSGLAVLRPQNEWQWFAFVVAVLSGAALFMISQFGSSVESEARLGFVVALVLTVELAALGWSFWQPGGSGPAPMWLEHLGAQNERVYTEGRITPLETVQTGLWTVEGIDPVQLQHYASYTEAATNCRSDVYSISIPAFIANAEAACPDRQLDSHLFGMLGVQEAVTSEAQEDPGWIPAGDISDGKLYLNAAVKPHVYLAHETQAVSANEDVLELLTGDHPDPPVLVVEGKDLSESADPLSHVNLKWNAADHFTVEVRSQSPGFVTTSIPYLPGWRAIDQQGMERQVHRAQLALTGIYVPAGDSSYDFTYSPDSQRLGAWIRGFALAASAIGLIIVGRASVSSKNGSA